MAILLYIFAGLIGAIVSATFLWMAMKIVRVEGSFLALLLASAMAIAIAFIPCLGGALSFIVLLYLLYKWTDMDSWMYGLLMVLIARALAMIAYIAVYALFNR